MRRPSQRAASGRRRAAAPSPRVARAGKGGKQAPAQPEPTPAPSVEEELIVQRVPWRGTAESSLEVLLGREWMVTNGLGGYASGTVAGVPTRRFHAFLVSALPSPLGRVVMLSQLTDQITLPDGRVGEIGGSEQEPGKLKVHGIAALKEFRLEHGLPVWRYEAAGYALEKRILMPHQQNTCTSNTRW